MVINNIIGPNLEYFDFIINAFSNTIY